MFREVFFQELFYLIVAVISTAVDWRFHEIVAAVLWVVVIGYPISAIREARPDVRRRD
jgi:hypothetical protein